MINVTVRDRPDRKHLQLAFTDPMTGTVKTRSAKTSNWKQAERAAARWEAEIIARTDPLKCNWEKFRQRFDDEYGIENDNTYKEYTATLNKFENTIGSVQRMDLINTSVCSQFQAKLKRSGLKPATVSKHLRQFGVILNWAADVGIIRESPKIRKPKLPKRSDRGRPLKLLEFVHLLRSTKDVVPGEHQENWMKFIKAMWLTGLRLAEAHALHWTEYPVRIDLDHEYPRIIYRSEGQKNNSDEMVPLTPDAVRFFSQLRDREGYVFKLRTEHRSARASMRRCGHIVSEIGKASQLVTNEAEEKFASSHDLRRTFGTRWAMRVHPIVLKTLMRHADLKTTLKYYVGLDCDEVAKQLNVHRNVQRNDSVPNLRKPKPK